MRLYRLEIAGFKSFPDRSELTFDHGVTAIVGPNGCGKSNVVDALTWVLGEQSAKSLRGDRMEDVIFGGSDARKPTAAAEVRLKLSGVAARVPGNGDRVHVAPPGRGRAARSTLPVTGTAAQPLDTLALALEDEAPLIVRDVELMRRLYRSGESEYLIDGETCRLRDVQDLLMDAGVGVKAYAVIEQGKIGQILSARPTDRRQLIEEAAGVTKYKTRRRAAELKLEAARQNLTRVDDIIFEVEKQRGALKRQAARARRYRRLRDDLRRWEKVQFAERYRRLGQTIESNRIRLADSKMREGAAAARLAELENRLESQRLELAVADAASTEAREAAHGCELEIERLQQQAAFSRQQVEQLGVTAADIQVEISALEARRGPAQEELEGRRQSARRAAAERDDAASALAAEETAYAEAQQQIEGLEGDVEAARSEVFAAVNAATALRHALEHAAAASARMADEIRKLEAESADLRVEAERAVRDREAAEESLAAARAAVDHLRVERAARESQLAGARANRDSGAQEFRTREHELASLVARLKSLEELDAARAEYGDGARALLAETDPDVAHLGSVADYLEVDRQFERAVEACLGERLQYVVVPSHTHAAAGLRRAAERNAGRVGFIIASGAEEVDGSHRDAMEGLTAMEDVVRVSGSAAGAIRRALAGAWLAPDFEAAAMSAGTVTAPVVTLDGSVFQGRYAVAGGERAEARGILATKREIKELREQTAEQSRAVDRLRDEIASLDITIASAESAIACVQSELHRQEKAIVGFELQLTNAMTTAERIARKQEQIGVERRSAEEEQRIQEARQQEARASIARIESDQRQADVALNAAQRRLFDAREVIQVRAHRNAEARATHAALVERAAALAADVQRLAEGSAELEARVAARYDDLRRTEGRRSELQQSLASVDTALDAALRSFDDLRERVREADERSQALRAAFEQQELLIRDARGAFDDVRGETVQLDLQRATAEADLSHLAQSCVESVQASLDEVAEEIARLERDGVLGSPTPIDETPEAAADTEPEASDDLAPTAIESGSGAGVPATGTAEQPADLPLTAEEMVAELRNRIERMGAVNMMAIDQFDDLESRHTFLTGQRKDLVDSIAATGEAIRRIDKTTKERFREAFTVINENFEQTFTTLFGGGRAGLVLLDETDQLDSGIDIIAQPPGKRLQNVQLLSGGEKALTAMALMFAIFKYRPSPFCLLDEIDAPLDDANIGRFVEMLQGMQDHTQFILITHNRKTMEIADRLYGVTMEEPGVSKLISVQLN